MSTHTIASPKGSAAIVLALLPLMATVFFAFLVAGIALPVLSLHVHEELGLSMLFVGLVTGSQFAAALLMRMRAGSYADGKGPKSAVVVGLVAAGVAGLLYLASLRFAQMPQVAGTVLLIGRAVLGAGESFIITGALAWGFTLAGPDNTGKVLAWMGTAMYAAFALGAPLGTALHANGGFGAIALATALIPLAILLGVVSLPAVAPTARARPSFLKVLGAVWVPGAGLALSSLGFGAITTFVALLFSEHHWVPGWPAFTAFAVFFMLARIALGGLVDRMGGARIALVSIAVEVVGQLMLWNASTPLPAIVGAALTGLGYSLIFPALGVEAVRRAPPESRALAMGAYTSCLDLALGLGAPALGLVAGLRGVGPVFLASGLAIACAAAPVAYLLRHPVAAPSH